VKGFEYDYDAYLREECPWGLGHYNGHMQYERGNKSQRAQFISAGQMPFRCPDSGGTFRLTACSVPPWDYTMALTLANLCPRL